MYWISSDFNRKRLSTPCVTLFVTLYDQQIFLNPIAVLKPRIPQITLGESYFK